MKFRLFVPGYMTRSFLATFVVSMAACSILALPGSNWAAPKLDVEEDPTNAQTGQAPTVVHGDLAVQDIWGDTRTRVKTKFGKTSTHTTRRLCIRIENHGPKTSPSYRVRAYLVERGGGAMTRQVLDSGWRQTAGAGETPKFCVRLDDQPGSHLVRATIQVRPYQYQQFKNMPVYQSVDPNLHNNRLSKRVAL